MTTCSYLRREDKIAIGINTVIYPLISIYPWYNLANGVAKSSAIGRIKECVCGALANATSCQSELESIIGPGLAISNITSFCKDATSGINVAETAATINLTWYAVLVLCLVNSLK